MIQPVQRTVPTGDPCQAVPAESDESDVKDQRSVCYYRCTGLPDLLKSNGRRNK